MDTEKGSNILQCENCSKCEKETFHKAFELKKTGLKIFKYKCWESSQAECLGHKPLTKKEYIILDNPSNNELRRPDFIKELCQYKTKCMCCKILIKRVLRLLEAIDEIKQREVIGLCEYCKRSSKFTCKKCKYLIDKYVEERTALEHESLFRQWLKELEHVLEPMSGDDEYSAAPSSRTKEPHRFGKYIPKEFRYPPTTREFFPDYGSPFVTQYPQPTETMPPPKFPVSSSQLHDMISKIIKTKHQSLKQRAIFDKSDRRRTILHHPLMRGSSEFPYIDLKGDKHDRLRFGSPKKERYKYGTQSEHTEQSELPTISPQGVNKLDKVNEEFALPRGRRPLPHDKQDIQTLVKNKVPYLGDTDPRMQHTLERHRGLVGTVAESLAYSKNLPETAKVKSPPALDETSKEQPKGKSYFKSTKDHQTFPKKYTKTAPPTLLDKISQRKAQIQKQEIILPENQSKDAIDRKKIPDKYSNVDSIDRTPQSQLPIVQKLHASSDDHPGDTFDKVATKIAPSTKSSRGPNTSIPEAIRQQKEYREKLLQKFSQPKQTRNIPDKTDKPTVQDKSPRSQSLPSTQKQKQRQSPNKLPHTHPFNKPERRKVKGPRDSNFSPKSDGILNKMSKKLLKGDTAQVQSSRRHFLEGITEILQKYTSPDQTDISRSSVEKNLQPRFPGTHKTKHQEDDLESTKPMGKNTKKGKVTPHDKFIELKTIIGKKRNRKGQTAKNVALKVDKEAHINQPKNLHKLDVKLEKLIYNTFVRRMQKIQEMKEEKKNKLREKRKQEKGIINELGVVYESLIILPKEIDAKPKGVSIIDLDLEEQEEEEDYSIFSPVMSSIQIDSDQDLAPVECAPEKKPNVKIVGDRIVRLKPNEVSEKPVFESVNLHYDDSKVNFNPPILYWNNPISEFGTPVLDARIVKYELSNPTWITNGWTKLPKEVTVKEICLYEMVPFERNWFLMHKNQDLFYKTGERLAILDEEGNGRVYYKNGKVAMEYNCNKEKNPERLVVFSSGEGAYKLAASKPIRKLAVFDHLGSGIIYDDEGRPRIKYNQYEGQKLDSDIKGAKRWTFHSLNQKMITKTQYKEIIEKIRVESLESFEIVNKKKDKRVASPQSKEEKDTILAIEKNNKKKYFESKKYDLFDCELGPIRINKHIVLNILNQRSINLHFEDAAGVVVNAGMRMLSNSLIGFLLGKETEVVTPMDDKINVHFL